MRKKYPLLTIVHRLLTGLALAGAASTCALAVAQDTWPHGKPITWVVPYPAAGSTDVMVRAIGQRMATALGATVVVDNRPGATGTIGGAYVAKSAPNGYTLLGTTIGAQTIAPHLIAHLSYDPLRDLQPLAMIGTIPQLLVTAPGKPYRSVNDILAAARSRPGEIAYASGGNGTILQVESELLAQKNQVRFIHIPYKGDAPGLQDTLGGQVDFMFVPAAAALAHVKSGRLRAIAVTSAKRLAVLPDVPTMGESGQKDFVVEQWLAAYAPAGTPAAITQRLNAELNRAMAEPQVRELAEQLGITLVGGTPEHLAQVQAADSRNWAQVIRNANIKAE